jgi:hypothetical protein
MNRTDPRRPGRTLLVLSFVLLLIFISLAVYHKFVTRRGEKGSGVFFA